MHQLDRARQRLRDHEAAAGFAQLRVAQRDASVHKNLQALTDAAYRYARRDRRTRGFEPAGQSGDAQLREALPLMHDRIRVEQLNNSHVKRIVDALVDLIVGTGMQTFADPFDYLSFAFRDDVQIDDLRPDLLYALESDTLFEEWFNDPKQVDVEGKRSGWDLQRLMLRECAQVGSAFLLRVQRRGPDRLLPLCYQVIERDQLDCTKDRPAGGPGENKIVNGIELDAANREVAFWVYDAHPFDYFGGQSALGKSSRIPADRMIHLYLFERPSQSSGATWLHAVAQNELDRDKYIGAEITTAARQAIMALIHYSDVAGSDAIGLDADEAGGARDDSEVYLGTDPLAIRLPAGDKVELVDTDRPNSDAVSFLQELDKYTAAGAGLSYYSLTGDMARTNYTGFKGAMMIEDQHMRPLQNWFATGVALPLRRRFNSQAARMGLLRTVTPAQFERAGRRLQRFDAVGAGRGLLDPPKESDAARTLIGSALSTLKIECAKRGLHWLRVLLQRSIETRVATLMGVVVDLSKGQGGNPEESRESSDESGEQESEAAA